MDSEELVQLEGLVVLKIIKHCQEMLPEFVTGQLLGVEVANTVEVTNCFPFPTNITGQETEDETEEERLGQKFQLDMMKCLRDVNVDNNTVGWYSSVYMESFFTESTIETQFAYQERIKKAVMLIYDPLKTSQGFLSLRAFRLTASFMESFKDGNFSSASKNFSFNDVFEEIPIKIHNSSLINAFLLELEESGKMDSEFERLDLSTGPMLSKHLEITCESLDDLAEEQMRFKKQMQKLKNKKSETGADEEPSRLGSLLLTNQINNHCREINRFSSNSLTKLFLATHLNNSQ